MNNTELQVYLANTAHQREVADLQAAGLNPILSAHNNGAAVPNVMSGSGSSGSRNSAKAIMAAGKANPLNKALGIIDKVVDQYKFDPKNPHVRPESVSPSSGPTSGSQVPNYTPSPYELSLGNGRGIPDNLVSSYTNGLLNTLQSMATTAATLGVAGPVPGITSGAIVRAVQKALKPVISAKRNADAAATINRIVHESEYGRMLMNRGR